MTTIATYKPDPIAVELRITQAERQRAQEACEQMGKRITNLEALNAALNAQLNAYRRLYDMWGGDGVTDAKFAEAYERVRMTDRV